MIQQQRNSYAREGGEAYHYAYHFAQDQNSAAILILNCGKPDQQIHNNLIQKISLAKLSFFTLDLLEQELNNIDTVSEIAQHLDDFVMYLEVTYAIKQEQLIVVAEGLSALVTLAWVHDYAPLIKSMILLSPTLLAKQSHVPQDTLLLFDHGVKNYAPSLRTDFVYTSKRIMADATAIYTSVRLITYTQTPKPERLLQEKLFNELSSSDKHISIVNLEITDIVIDTVLSFVDEVKNRITQSHWPELLSAHKQGKTKDELVRYTTPETDPVKKIRWFFSRIVLRQIGKRFSKGVKIGLDYGFDSGVSLDYIYQNTPQGKTFIHRWLDNYYLSQRGFDATRKRKYFVECLLLKAINALLKDGKTVNILDIAAGNAHYLIDVIKHNQENIHHVLMRDFDEYHIEEGKALLEKESLSHLVDFEWGDGFSEESLASLPKDITITVASGFYELFSDNERVLRSLNGIANAMASGGYLIITTKIWNPSLEYMARVMTSQRNNDAWALRRRYQLEIDQLAAQAGFIKKAHCVDRSGIFTVTLYKNTAKV